MIINLTRAEEDYRCVVCPSEQQLPVGSFSGNQYVRFFWFFAYGSESIISKKRQAPFLFIYLLIYLFSFLLFIIFFFFVNGDLFCLICGNKGLQNGVFTFFRTICHSNIIEVILNKSYCNSWFPIVNLVFMKIYVLGLLLKMLWTNLIEGFFKPHYHKKY